MSGVIEFLERMGRDALLRRAGSDEVLKALATSNIGSVLSEAILAPDRNRLETLLGANSNVFCGQHIPEDQDDEETGLARKYG